MEPHSFYTLFVEEDFRCFEANPGDFRLAFASCVSVSHLADHIWAYFARRDIAFRARFPTAKDEHDPVAYGKYLENLSIEFRDIRSISNAYKHLYTRSSSTVGSPGSLERVSVDHGTEMEAEYGERIFFTKKDGNSVSLLNTLSKAKDFIEIEMLHRYRSLSRLSKV